MGKKSKHFDKSKKRRRDDSEEEDFDTTDGVPQASMHNVEVMTSYYLASSVGND